MINRNTKQKEIIFEILNFKRTHPTIQEIYSHAKEKYPNIGQATIYRHVNKLVEEGKLLKITNNIDKNHHYDININPHHHLICEKCGKIYDYFDNDYRKIITNLENKNSIKINKIIISLEGICQNCNKE